MKIKKTKHFYKIKDSEGTELFWIKKETGCVLDEEGLDLEHYATSVQIKKLITHSIMRNLDPIVLHKVKQRYYKLWPCNELSNHHIF